MIVYPRETFPHTRTARAQPPAAHRRRHSRLHHRRHEKHSPTARQPHSNGLSNAQVARGMPTTSRLAWSGQATPAYTQRAAAIPVYPFRFDSISCHILITPTRRLREVRRPLLGQPGLARPHQHIHNGPRRYLYTVESTEGISDIWFCESFPRWGFLILRVRVRFTYGSEFTRIQSETPLWSNSGFDGPFHFNSNACHIRSIANSQHARGTPTTSRSAWSGQATPAYIQRAVAIPVYRRIYRRDFRHLVL